LPRDDVRAGMDRTPPADRDAFERLREAFHRLSALDAAAREAGLRELASQAPQFAAQLRDLLAHLDEADLDTAPEPGLPERIGPFRIVRRIGRGGMGEVFLAERADGEVAQRVALKRVARAGLSPDLARRFLRERDLLARLSHPHVARLIDAGSSDADGPWFAMEYVEGESIVRHADARTLDVAARLALWLQVADAVAYAHRHSIVHRDLKPANVLVDSDGHAHLLDFGIAKLVEVEIDAGVTAPAFTARYASPEQITGEAITTATDVHGLGLLLFELLAGRPPFRDGNDLALRQAIAHTDPPSLLASIDADGAAHANELAMARAASIGELRRTLGGDLDAIVGKALRKRPNERYGSVPEFSADVRRFLAGEAVAAVAPTTMYRLRRFVGRHRVASAAVVLSIAGLSIALAATLQQRAGLLLATRQAEAENALLLQVIEGGDPYHVLGSELRVVDVVEQASREALARTDLAPRLRAPLLDRLGRALLAQSRMPAAEAAFAGAQESLALDPGAPEELRVGVELRRALTRFELDDRAPARAALDVLWPRIVRMPPRLRIEALEWRAHMHRATGENEAALSDIDAALALCGTRCGGQVDARTSLVVKRIDLLSRLHRSDEALAQADAEWSKVQALPAEFAAIRVLVGESRSAALAFAGRNDAADRMLDELLPFAETLYAGRGNRLAALYSQREQVQRNRARHRQAAASAGRVVALYSATLPDSVYLAYALKIEGVNLRLVAEHASAIAVLERARTMFERVEGAGSAEAAWSGINVAAARLGASHAPVDLAELVRLGAAHLESSARLQRWVTALLVAENAVDFGSEELARRWLGRVREETAALSNRNAAHDDRVAGLELEFALRRNEPVRARAIALATRWRQQGDAGVDLARLLTALARAFPDGATCDAARSSWQSIDTEGVAWRDARRRLPRCGEID
jgi:eukaryotic-like serine/threonine-protein kinase